MGKVEYDVFADGKKVGTASRDQTGFEKMMDEAASESRHREAGLNLIIESAQRLAAQYGALSGRSKEEERASRIKWSLKEEKEKNQKLILAIVLIFFVGMLGIHRFVAGPKWVGGLYLAIIAVYAINIFPQNAMVIALLVLLCIDFVCLVIQTIRARKNIKRLEKELEEAIKKAEAAKKRKEKEEKEKKEENNSPTFRPYVMPEIDTRAIIEKLLD